MLTIFILFYLLNGPVHGNGENDMQKFARRLEALERQVAEQREINANQAEQLLDQSKVLTNLKNVVTEQESTISELRHTCTTEQQQMKQVLQQLQQQMQQQHLEDMLKDHIGAQNISRRFVMDGYETVAFHATVGSGTKDHIAINQTLVFETVKLNIGGGYHASGGIFITPVAGIYIFSTSVTFNNNQDESHMIIEKNGVEIAGSYGNARAGPHEQGSITVVMELKVGDEVYVSNQRHNDVIVYGDNLSSFMGCMIIQI